MEEKQKSIEEKQAYLRKEIRENEYDGEDFLNYFCELKGLVAIDLDIFSIDDLKNVVDSYKQIKLGERNASIYN